MALGVWDMMGWGYASLLKVDGWDKRTTQFMRWSGVRVTVGFLALGCGHNLGSQGYLCHLV